MLLSLQRFDERLLVSRGRLLLGIRKRGPPGLFPVAGVQGSTIVGAVAGTPAANGSQVSPKISQRFLNPIFSRKIIHMKFKMKLDEAQQLFAPPQPQPQSQPVNSERYDFFTLVCSAVISAAIALLVAAVIVMNMNTVARFEHRTLKWVETNHADNSPPLFLPPGY